MLAILQNLTQHLAPKTQLKRLCMLSYMCCSIVLINTIIPNTAQAQSIFSWFSDKKDNSDNTLLDENTVQVEPPKDMTYIQQAAFGELVYHYFQEDYQQVLQAIEVGQLKHGFSLLSQDDSDRVNLMQGAAQLQLGMYQQAQEKFATLLSQTTSDYVQAHTWFFMAKAGFENKQAYLSERAYDAIGQGDLREELSDQQWQELLYLTAHTRMQNNGDWQSIDGQMSADYIYRAYLRANQGALLFNQANYEASTTSFVAAKQSLLAYQNRRGFVSRLASSVFAGVTKAVTPWRWFDKNAVAEQAIKERQAQQSIDEQDALFDRINIGLGQSLLQQGELGNAIAVIQTIADQGAESDQALLTYGWANARENRWQQAMAAWQYLQTNSIGLYALQASYGLAYAFNQQDNLGQAFYALATTATQIDESLLSLSSFETLVVNDGFFDDYHAQWPQPLLDLKLGFFEPTQNFDAKYLLNVRQQASDIMRDINRKQTRIEQLDKVLQEREAVYNNRLASLSLAQMRDRIAEAQGHIDTIQSLINQADSFEAQLALSKKMSDGETQSQVERLNNALGRHARLASDNTRKRPLRPSLKTRLARIEGILTWQLMDNFIAQRWQHQKLLTQAKNELASAQAQFQQLKSIGQKQDAFSSQRAQFAAFNQSLQTQTAAAQQVYANATNALTQELLTLIASRQSQLEEQGVNTRLSMLRIQDLQADGAMP